MIHLIGVNHDVQIYKAGAVFTDDQTEYKAIIESAISCINPVFVAEEENPEHHDDWKSCNYRSVLFECSKESGLDILHDFIDPNEKRRNEIGYRRCQEINELLFKRGEERPKAKCKAHEIAHQFRKRELEWLEKLRPCCKSEILFVCGDLHLHTFPRILQEEAISFNFLACKVGVSSNQYWFYDALQYAQEKLQYDDSTCFCRQELVSQVLF